MFDKKNLIILGHSGQIYVSTGTEIMVPAFMVVMRIQELWTTIAQLFDRYHHFKYGLMVQSLQKCQDVLNSLGK